MSDNPSPETSNTPTVADLKAKLAEVKSGATSMSPDELFQLYDQLLTVLDKPRTVRSKMSPEEKRAHRRERREARKRGEYIRVGKPWSDEQRAKQQEAWTPERRAAASEKAKGRTLSPEALENVRSAAQKRKERQAAMEARLAELEALVGGQAHQPEPQAEESNGGHRKGRRGQ